MSKESPRAGPSSDGRVARATPVDRMVDLRRLRTYSIAQRKDLVQLARLGKPTDPAETVNGYFRHGFTDYRFLQIYR